MCLICVADSLPLVKSSHFVLCSTQSPSKASKSSAKSVACCLPLSAPWEIQRLGSTGDVLFSTCVCVFALRYITASSLAVCLTFDRRPKGTAFLEFATVEGADTAVAAANKIDNVNTGVLVVKGHELAVNLALDRDQARNVAKQASIQQDDHDRRHLKLAKASFSSSTTLEADVYLEVILLQA